MPRSLDPALVTYLQGRRIKTAFFIEIFINNQWLYLTTAARDVQIGSITYFRTPTLSIEGVAQNLELQNNEASVSLSGIPQAWKSLILNQEYVGNTLIIKQGFFDWQTDQLVGSLYQVHKGFINGMAFVDDIKSGTATITLPVSSIFARFEDRNGMMTNPSKHKRLFPNDKIFDQVPELADKLIEFGKL